MTFTLKIAATAVALILAPLAVLAHHKPGHDGGRGNGHGNGHHQTTSDDDRDNDSATDGETDEAGRHPCPPGLAGRNPACVPPGQARQGVTTEDWIGAPSEDYATGDILGEDDGYGWVGNADRLGLDPLPEGERYAIVDDTIVVVDEATLEILEIIRRAAIAGNSGG